MAPHTIIEALAAHRIRAHAAVPLPDFEVALSMSPFEMERFLDLIVPRPISGDDALTLHVIGRPQDLGVDDDPWSFELVPGVSDAGVEFHAVANIPAADVPEVWARLGIEQEADK